MNFYRLFTKAYLMLCFIFCASSCLNEERDYNASYQEILVDNREIEATKDISELVENITCIPLQDVEGNMLGDVYKVHAVNGKYAVFDRLINNRIILFDSTGKFEKLVIASGKGPNTALNLTDSWTTTDGRYEVYDYAQMKIFRFDSAFELSNTLKGKEFFHFVNIRKIPGKDDYICYAGFDQKNRTTNGAPYQMALLDKELNLAYTSEHFDKAFDGIAWLVFREHFPAYQDTLRFIRAYDNFVYNVTSSGVEKRFKITYKKDPLPEDVMKIVRENILKFKDRTMNPNVQSASLKKYARFGGIWLESEKYIYFFSRDSEGEYGNPFLTLVDRKNMTVIFNASSYCETKRYKLKLPPLIAFDQKRNEFIGVVTGKDLKAAMFENSNFYPYEIKDLESFFLIKIKLK